MEKLKKVHILDWKCNKRSYVPKRISAHIPKKKLIKKFKEFKLLNFLLYCTKLDVLLVMQII